MAGPTNATLDWNPSNYLDYRGPRLRPALDLISAVGAIPEGDVIDLGCGPGNVGPALKARFGRHRLIGVDNAPAMLDRARAQECYGAVEAADIATWVPETPPALIYSNAALQWLPEHDRLFPRLIGDLAPRGTLAVQMPRQHESPAYRMMREIAAALFPDLFDWTGWADPVHEPAHYVTLLSPMGDLEIWQTTYYHRLAPSGEGHPVRLMAQSSIARPILARLDDAAAAMFLHSWDASLAEAYPAQPDGTVLYPFRRLFLTITLPT